LKKKKQKTFASGAACPAIATIRSNQTFCFYFKKATADFKIG
jgi:hypothetical protein